MNVELLQRVVSAIEQRPHAFSMHTFFSYTDEAMRSDIASLLVALNSNEGGHRCGTTACIAGWALALTHTPIYYYPTDGYGDVFKEACRLLDISDGQGLVLFYANEWPHPFRTDYLDAKYVSQQRVSVTVRRIQHFIATGGRE